MIKVCLSINRSLFRIEKYCNRRLFVSATNTFDDDDDRSSNEVTLHGESNS